VLWGLFHGGFLVIERSGLGPRLERWPRPLRHAYALLVVMTGWVLFRADTLPHALAFLSAMSGFGAGDGVTRHLSQYLRPDVALVFAAGVVLATPVLRRNGGATPKDGEIVTVSSHLGSTRVPTPLAALGVLVALTLVTMSLASGTYNPFIYFRF
jgi:alginate O-acetyltransferase complex protein AlgI